MSTVCGVLLFLGVMAALFTCFGEVLTFVRLAAYIDFECNLRRAYVRPCV